VISSCSEEAGNFDNSITVACNRKKFDSPSESKEIYTLSTKRKEKIIDYSKKQNNAEYNYIYVTIFPVFPVQTRNREQVSD
jgi:hypothetical protein